MLKFRFFRDMFGDISGVMVTDSTLHFTGYYLTELDRIGLYFKRDMSPESPTETADDNYVLVGTTDYRRKDLKRAVIRSKQFRKALADYLHEGHKISYQEMEVIMNNVPSSQTTEMLQFLSYHSAKGQMASLYGCAVGEVTEPKD